MWTRNRKTGFKYWLHNILSMLVNFTLLSLNFIFLITTKNDNNNYFYWTVTKSEICHVNSLVWCWSHDNSSITHYHFLMDYYHIFLTSLPTATLGSLWLRILKWLPLHVNKSSPYNGLKDLFIGSPVSSSTPLPLLSQEPWICALCAQSTLP